MSFYKIGVASTDYRTVDHTTGDRQMPLIDSALLFYVAIDCTNINC